MATNWGFFTCNISNVINWGYLTIFESRKKCKNLKGDKLRVFKNLKGDKLRVFFDFQKNENKHYYISSACSRIDKKSLNYWSKRCFHIYYNRWNHKEVKKVKNYFLDKKYNCRKRRWASPNRILAFSLILDANLLPTLLQYEVNPKQAKLRAINK